MTKSIVEIKVKMTELVKNYQTLHTEQYKEEQIKALINIFMGTEYSLIERSETMTITDHGELLKIMNFDFLDEIPHPKTNRDVKVISIVTVYLSAQGQFEFAMRQFDKKYVESEEFFPIDRCYIDYWFKDRETDLIELLRTLTLRKILGIKRQLLHNLNIFFTMSPLDRMLHLSSKYSSISPKNFEFEEELLK